MDGVQRLTGIAGATQVHERNAGSQNRQQQADAFREAMQEQAASGDGAANAAEREPAPPLRRALQPRGGISRNQQGEAQHVDVIA